MSDETPTQRFDAAGDQQTTRMDAAVATGTTEQAGPPPEDDRKSRRLVILLGSIGAALLVALIVLLVILLSRGDVGEPIAVLDPTVSPTATPAVTEPTPTAADTPVESPTPTASQTVAAPPPPPPPQQAGPKITAFTGTSTIFCNTQAPNPPSYELSFSWTTTGVDAVYFGVATGDASTGALFEGLPPSGNSADDFPYAIAFPCPTEQQTYTLTVVGDGQKVHKKVTVINEGDTQ